LLDLGLLSMSAGLFSVPMYALIQVRSRASHRSRIIAANNILNALYMVASALIAAALLMAGVSLPGLFLCLGLANALMLLWLLWRVPELLHRARAIFRGS
jgi:O-antigen/teichoic acid export membrane protein